MKMRCINWFTCRVKGIAPYPTHECDAPVHCEIHEYYGGCDYEGCIPGNMLIAHCVEVIDDSNRESK